ncbi:MAG: tetratricopeptide repeat protein [Candidatus Marinimicrobia bacterium]|nr:tetratricopeptide repeat protein [Candidatus Neomarinimicrobiota bacterium]MCF7880242.1 tetratricopeptide repeat protein [Candidatus Neomarinimicrobiota bacterium]
MSKAREYAGKNLSRGKRWLFTFVLIVIIPLILLLLLEAGLRITGYGYSPDFLVKQTINGQEFFTDNTQFSYRFFPRELARPAQRLAIPIDKSPDEFRIVVLGASAAMGDPDYSFGVSRILEELLQHQYQERKIRVINAAITAINSNVVLPIARDIAKLEPDVLIVYLGNNEVIGPYGPGTVFAPFAANLGLIRANIFLKSTKIGQMVNDISRGLQSGEVKQETWGGVDMFTANRIRHSDPRMENVYNHFQKNLQDISEAGTDVGAKVILSTVGTNLQGCPPFAALHSNQVDSASLLQWENLYQQGLSAEESQDYESAIGLYQDAAKIDGVYADLHFRLAESHTEVNQNDSAKAHYIRARDRDALRFRADSRINKIVEEVAEGFGEKTAALTNATNIFQSDSDDGIPGENLFYDHVHMNFRGNYLLAKKLAKQAAELLDLGESGEVLTQEECENRLAFTLYDQVRIEREILNRLQSPAFANRMDNEEAVREAEANLEQKQNRLRADVRLATVENEYKQAIALNEQDWILRKNYGLFLLEARNKPDLAEEQFRFVLERFPYDYLSQNNLGMAYARQGKLHDAIGRFEQALELKPGFTEAHFNIARILEQQDRYEEAHTHYNQAHLTPEEMTDLYIRYAQYLSETGQRDQAVMRLREAIHRTPNSPKAYLMLGNLYENTGHPDSAIKYLSEAVRLGSENTKAHIDLGTLLFKRENYPEAENHYKRALELSPDLPEVQNNLGLALVQQGKFAEAIPHFRKAVESRPDYLAARGNLAGALSRVGRNDEAITQLEGAIRFNPNNPSIHNNLGAQLLNAGKVEEAITHFKKALELDPDLYSAKNNLNYALSLLENDDG